MEQDEVWTSGKRYFDMSAYWQWRTAHARQQNKGQVTTNIPLKDLLLPEEQSTDNVGLSRGFGETNRR